MGRDTRDSYRDRRDDNYPDERGDSRRERSARYQGSDAGGSGRLSGGPIASPTEAAIRKSGRSSGRLPRGRSDPRLRRSDSPPPTPAYDEPPTRSRDYTGERANGGNGGRPDAYDTPGRSRNGRRGMAEMARTFATMSRQLSAVMSRVGRAVEGTPRGMSRAGGPGRTRRW